MRRFAVPFLSYLAVTVVVPVLNGACIAAPFAEHVARAAGLPIAIAAVLSRLLPGGNRTRRAPTCGRCGGRICSRHGTAVCSGFR